jgi:hypothetical protein
MFVQGYQGKRIDNTSVRDEPFEFVVGGDGVSVMQQYGSSSSSSSSTAAAAAEAEAEDAA